ncbi:MAG TPA: hypothetical protein PLJ78_14790 [Anaerolineae bacterium]|nr:hypothetical protein [Anaerolineae bacterium]HQK15197.1 hypothetical protein [Anaerolineae bacterium]
MDTQTVKQYEQQDVMTTGEPRHNGRLWESFPEPRGWAARWDGFALDLSARRNGHNTQYPIAPQGH